MEKLKISRAIIVEGKYDKIKLSSLIDGVIIVTNGFGVYKDPDTVALIRFYAEKSGIIILTDSDSAGFRIRGHIKSIVPKGDIVNVYIPEIFGKEKRKSEPSKEGMLGVEGVSADIIREAFEKAGVIGETVQDREKITKMDFYDLGLSGGENSASFRQRLSKSLSLPSRITTGALLEIVNAMFDRQDFFDYVKTLDNKEQEIG